MRWVKLRRPQCKKAPEDVLVPLWPSSFLSRHYTRSTPLSRPALRLTKKQLLQEPPHLQHKGHDQPNAMPLCPITTVFIDTRLWKTKHSRKRFQNFRQSCVLSTSVTFRPSLAGCDWWILSRAVDNMYDWRKFWKSFRECFVFQSRVSTKTVVNTSIKFSFIASTLEVYRNDFDLVSKGLCIETDQKLVRFWKLFSQTVFQKLISLSVLINLLQVLAICTFFCICCVTEMFKFFFSYFTQIGDHFVMSNFGLQSVIQLLLSISNNSEQLGNQSDQDWCTED